MRAGGCQSYVAVQCLALVWHTTKSYRRPTCNFHYLSNLNIMGVELWVYSSAQKHPVLKKWAWSRHHHRDRGRFVKEAAHDTCNLSETSG